MKNIKYIFIAILLSISFISCGKTVEDDIKELAEITVDVQLNTALFFKGELSGNEVKKKNEELTNKLEKIKLGMDEKLKDKTAEDKANYRKLLKEEIEKRLKEVKEENKK